MHPVAVLFSKAEALRGASLRARTIESIQEQVRDFLKDAVLLAIPRTYEQVWYRARLCEDNQPFNSLHELIYPPEGSKDFGRAQFPRAKVLYASWNQATALEEVGASGGDLVQTIKVRLRREHTLICHVVGELQYFNAAGRSQIRSGPAAQQLFAQAQDEGDDFEAKIFIDSVMADFFRRFTKRAYEHKITAAYAELMHRTGGGLMYPSVETLGSMNLAVSGLDFDTKFEVLETTVMRVRQYFGYGLYSHTEEKYSAKFASDGTIDWNHTDRVSSTRHAFGGELCDPEFVGWRKG